MSNHLPEVTQLAHSRSRALGQAISPKALLFTLELPCLSESAYVRGWHEKERETTVVSSQTVHLILGKGWGFSGGDGKRRKWGGGQGQVCGPGFLTIYYLYSRHLTWLTHRRRVYLIEERLENHCEGLMLVELAGGQEILPGFLREREESTYMFESPNQHTRTPHSTTSTHDRQLCAAWKARPPLPYTLGLLRTEIEYSFVSEAPALGHTR